MTLQCPGVGGRGRSPLIMFLMCLFASFFVVSTDLIILHFIL